MLIACASNNFFLHYDFRRRKATTEGTKMTLNGRRGTSEEEYLFTYLTVWHVLDFSVT